MVIIDIVFIGVTEITDTKKPAPLRENIDEIIFTICVITLVIYAEHFLEWSSGW